MTTMRFQEVALRGVWRWKDAEGKWHQQTKKFFQTLNPFNKTADGIVKTREQIMQALHAEREAWYDKCAHGGD
jgi:hypothetical protein